MKRAARVALTVICTLLVLALVAFSAHAALPPPGAPGAPADPRYCGEPARAADGRIARSQTVLRDFAEVFPCPSTLKPTTSCPGWAIDHVVPLATGGCDTSINLQWLPTRLKSCAGICKDRWERQYHGQPRKRINLKGKKP